MSASRHFVLRLTVMMAMAALSVISTIITSGGTASAQASGSPVTISPSCYDSEHAPSADDDDADQTWLASEAVQMSLRQISLLVDMTPLLHGYEISEARQSVAVVHDRSLDSDDVADGVRGALTLARADIGGGAPILFPSVVVFPACRQLSGAAHFDALESSIGTTEWTDEPLDDRIAFALSRDLLTTQVVFHLKESNALTDRVTKDLQTYYGDDVRVIVDPDHPKFFPTLALSATDSQPATPDEQDDAEPAAPQNSQDPNSPTASTQESTSNSEAAQPQPDPSSGDSATKSPSNPTRRLVQTIGLIVCALVLLTGLAHTLVRRQRRVTTISTPG